MKKVYSVVLLVVLTVCGCLLTGCGKSVDISQFITITCEGASGYATISGEVKQTELMKEIVGEDAISDMSSIEDLEDVQEYLEIATAIQGINVEFDKTEQLKNGDVVKVTVKVSEDNLDKLGASLDNMEYEYTVEGLKEVTVVDAFAEDMLEISYSGASPNVAVAFQNITGNSALSSIYYSSDRGSDLKNGDTITITAEYDEDELLEKGYALKETEKTFTIAAPYKYVAANADIPESFDTKLQEQAEDVINVYTTEKDVKKVNWKYEGKYVLGNKSTNIGYGDSYGAVYYVFSGKIVPKDKEYKPKNVYMAVRYRNITIGEDGTSTFIPSDEAYRFTEGCEYYNIGWWSSFECYTSEQDLFDNCVTKYTDRYNYEVTGDLKDLK